MRLECTVFESEIDNLDLRALRVHAESDDVMTLAEELEEALEEFVEDHDELKSLEVVISDEEPDQYDYPLGRGDYREKNYGPSSDAVEVKAIGISMANGGRIGSMAVPVDRQRNYSLAAGEVIDSTLKSFEGSDAD